ncbi:MAG: MerR family transcriptional regulator [Hungatella sp.]
MAEIHYLISDASKKVDVESHVLRYWEDELALDIPRNDLGHRYYTEVHIRLFHQIKDLKEKGYQLKAIKSALNKMTGAMENIVITDIMEEDMTATWKDHAAEESTAIETGLTKVQDRAVVTPISTEKLQQFQQIMNHVIGQALEANQENLSLGVGEQVTEKVMKELEGLMRINDEKEEERFKQLDETLRTYQKNGKGRAEAAATKLPFFKKKKFGRSGKKLL